MNTPRSQHALFVSVLSLAILAHVTSVSSSTSLSEDPVFEEPRSWVWTPTTMKTLSLGHEIFAANLVWIDSLLYFADWRLAKLTTPPRHLLDYANLVAELDPGFKRVYRWLSTTYINARLDVTMSDLHTVSDFMDKGIERFPLDCELPFMAGSNYVGYSVERTPRERLEEIARATRYFERASILDDCNPQIPFALAYFYRRRSALQKQLVRDATEDDALMLEQRRDFLKTIYLLTTRDEVRERAYSSLRNLGLSPEDIDALKSTYTRPLERARARTMPYLPVDHWSLIVAPPERTDSEATP